MNDKEHPAGLPQASVERKLAAILSADVAGYSRLMGADEVGTLRTLTAYRAVMDPLIHQHRGRIVGTAGDSVLAEFASAVDAVQCAVEIQQALKAQNTDLPPERKMEFRIGINVGDVVVEGEQIYGDGVNVAARLQALADAGGIFISGTVYDQIENKLALNYEYLGEQTVKNIARPVRVYRVRLEKAESPASGVRSPESKGQDPQPRRLGTAHRAWVVVAGLAFIVGVIVSVWYLARSSLSPQSSALVTQEAQPALLLPDKPSVVVLPFKNMSEDPQQEYFSDGLTEDLTSDLSQTSSLFVISRNSAFTYKDKAVKLPEVSRELGVRYVVEGSVRKAGDHVRITAQLIDATKDQHLWSERYDRPLSELFALQDEIRQKIVFALKVKLTPEEHERFQRAPTNNLEAYDFYLRGGESVFRALYERKKEANAQARQMYEKALELDPKYAGAYAGLGFSYFLDWFYQWNTDRAQSLERAFAMTQRAVALDDSLPLPHQVLGGTYLWKKQYEQAIVEAERAIALDPNDAEGYLYLGSILVQAGRPEEGIELIEKAMRLNPRYPPIYLLNLGGAYREAGRCEEALVPLKKALTLNPNFGPAHLNLAACYAELGRLEEARAEVAEVLRVNPNASLEVFKQITPYKNPADLERFLAGLRKAGLK
jgi:adenylate cyclase